MLADVLVRLRVEGGPVLHSALVVRRQAMPRPVHPLVGAGSRRQQAQHTTPTLVAFGRPRRANVHHARVRRVPAMANEWVYETDVGSKGDNRRGPGADR